MKINKILPPTLLYNMPQEVRHHTFGLSRIIYISILGIFCLLIVHYLFYGVYLLRGDAFIDSDKETLELEYDSHIVEVFVENGGKVRKGEPVLIYDSSEFRGMLVKAISSYSDIITKRQTLLGTISKLEAIIAASTEYLSSTQEAEKNLKRLNQRGNASIDRLMTEKTRNLEAYRDILGFKAELEVSKKAYEDLNDAFRVSKEALSHLIKKFNKGVKNASVEGVITDLNVQSGNVVKAAEKMASIYFGKRYLSTLFESSFIGFSVGDHVIVLMENGALKIGQVVDVSHYALELPDEIRPRYRPPGRRNTARILIDNEDLEQQGMLSIATVYKPLGLKTICAIFRCKNNLIDEYRNYLKDREQLRADKIREHAKENEYIKNVKE